MILKYRIKDRRNRYAGMLEWEGDQAGDPDGEWRMSWVKPGTTKFDGKASAPTFDQAKRAIYRRYRCVTLEPVEEPDQVEA